MSETMLSVKEYAEREGISRQAALKRVSSGLVPGATMKDGLWTIPADNRGADNQKHGGNAGDNLVVTLNPDNQAIPVDNLTTEVTTRHYDADRLLGKKRQENGETFRLQDGTVIPIYRRPKSAGSRTTVADR